VTLLEGLRRRFPYRDKEYLLAKIVCGEVLIDGIRLTDPKVQLSRGSSLDFEVVFLRRRYVSRGGEKLEAALREFRVIPAARVFLDAGASTGGFTDCLLKHGAALVHAVDVGRNELAPELRKNPRVIPHEGTNVMDLEALDPTPSIAVCDISFRTVRKVVAKLMELTEGGEAITLVKPQFELAGRRGQPEEFDGVVRNPALLTELFQTVVAELAGDGVVATAWMLSPIRGRRGNREAFFRFRPREGSRGAVLRPEDIDVEGD
jgi:23S rRNA (cytidine1920-2'-O)/16S rRNA (cytidine1409-2'-O)-methyltransferase